MEERKENEKKEEKKGSIHKKAYTHNNDKIKLCNKHPDEKGHKEPVNRIVIQYVLKWSSTHNYWIRHPVPLTIPDTLVITSSPTKTGKIQTTN